MILESEKKVFSFVKNIRLRVSNISVSLFRFEAKKVKRCSFSC
jgi:hypothetical protein